MPRPRIAILAEFSTVLGGERSLLSVLMKLKQQYDFYVFAPKKGTLATQLRLCEVNHIPFSVRDVQGKRKPDEELLEELLGRLKEMGCQLLHGNSVSLGRFLGRHRDQFPIPVTAHLRDIMKFSAKAIRDISNLDRLIAVSKATAVSYDAQGVPEEKITIVYNGIDTDSFHPSGSLNLHRELNLPDQIKFAVTIGQIGLRKAHDVLVEAIPKLVSSFSDWHFLIVGQRYSEKQESEQYEAQMLKSLSDSQVSHSVHWLGYREDVADILQQSELLIHPARQEPFGRVLLEAASLGVAILATDVGGTSEMLTHQKEAWLIPANDAGAIQESCEELFSNSVLRQQLGKQAKLKIAKQLTVEKSANAHAAIWDVFCQSF